MTSWGRLEALRSIEATPGTLVMGIVNTTPDSFSDGGRYDSTEVAVAHAEQLLKEGADIVDVGGESSRPGAEPVDPTVEIDRVVPVIEHLADRCIVSIDTAKPAVAAAALHAGAHIVNDITASLEEVAGAHQAGWMAMHMLGEPRTMQVDPTYDDVVAEIMAALSDAAARGERAGVPAIWLDPGIGFGKTTGHNLELLRDLGSFRNLGHEIAVGVSRKRFIGELHASSDGIDVADTHDRLEGSVASAVWAARAGARIVRVHDVRSTTHALRLLSG
ncbi:MAG: dihydropteroate synthase [Acidimicrobiales bacterium]